MNGQNQGQATVAGDRCFVKLSNPFDVVADGLQLLPVKKERGSGQRFRALNS
jgi:hypothetical protein